jgi:hypothetical protein
MFSKVKAAVLGLGAMVLSGVVGVLTNEPTVWVRDLVQDYVCGTTRHLETGLRLQRETVRIDAALRRSGQRIDARVRADLDRQYEDANRALEAAAACGSALAMLRRASMDCIGLGTPRNWHKGLRLAREAIAKEPKLAAEWDGNPSQCPRPDPEPEPTTSRTASRW